VQRACQRVLKLFEFVVDGDAQRLKDARGRVPRGVARCPGRAGSGDGLGEIARRSQGAAGTPFDEFSGELAAVGFFSEIGDDLRQSGFVDPFE
jgi:hypothetical protein